MGEGGIKNDQNNFRRLLWNAPKAWLGLALMMITRPEILENYPKGDINAGHDILVFRYHNVSICPFDS